MKKLLLGTVLGTLMFASFTAQAFAADKLQSRDQDRLRDGSCQDSLVAADQIRLLDPDKIQSRDGSCQDIA